MHKYIRIKITKKYPLYRLIHILLQLAKKRALRGRIQGYFRTLSDQPYKPLPIRPTLRGPPPDPLTSHPIIN